MGGKKASVRVIRPHEEVVPGEPVRAVAKGAGGRKLPKIPEGAWGIRFDAVGKAWDCAKGLYDPAKAPARLMAIAPEGNDRLALGLFALGGLLVFAIWFLSSIEYIYVLNFEFDTIGNITGEELPKMELGVLAPVAAYEFLLWGVLAFIINLAHEGIAFFLAKITGGRGTLGGQMYLSSVVWLAISMSMVAVLLGPLYLLCIISIASLVLVSVLYLGVYMTARAYSIAHGIDFAHALVIALVLAITKVLMLAVAMDLLAAVLGMGNYAGV
ncbi:hypothetical protein L0Y65_04115 [Candidatus Micrarchaeota archaeon]|nr:hypothetical protein [Candidatus Micrarchaeota archaeon]